MLFVSSVSSWTVIDTLDRFVDAYFAARIALRATVPVPAGAEFARVSAASAVRNDTLWLLIVVIRFPFFPWLLTPGMIWYIALLHAHHVLHAEFGLCSWDSRVTRVCRSPCTPRGMITRLHVCMRYVHKASGTTYMRRQLCCRVLTGGRLACAEV